MDAVDCDVDSVSSVTEADLELVDFGLADCEAYSYCGCESVVSGAAYYVAC